MSDGVIHCFDLFAFWFKGLSQQTAAVDHLLIPIQLQIYSARKPQKVTKIR